MKISFVIEYHTHWGQQLCIAGNHKQLGDWEPSAAFDMHMSGNGIWQADIEIEEKDLGSVIQYKYFVKDQNFGTQIWEWGNNRVLNPISDASHIRVEDEWRSTGNESNALHTSPFINAFMKRPEKKATKAAAKTAKGKFPLFRFKANVPRIDAHHHLAIVGSDPALGAWDETKAIVMDDKNFPVWYADVQLKGKDEWISYKYGIYDTKAKKVVTWETGDNRSIKRPEQQEQTMIVHTDEKFRYPVGNWKGAGVAIPVFSIRTKNGLGVGEFLDLKLLVDWAKKTGMKLVQILPVNDTTATHTWTDSYPYAAISVFALHPIYINLEAISPLSSEVTQKILKKQKEVLNAKDSVDYEAVMTLKMKCLQLLYDEQKEKLATDAGYQAFIESNASWLKAYAAFCYLRDLFGTPDFSQWDEFGQFSDEKLAKITNPKAGHFHQVAIHYFIQYHLHLQLKEAATYARGQGIVLKGDIPIGIYRHSVDAWVQPEQFNMITQAGAPPDDFAVNGQNWGFPTYNWDEMAKDGYQWWKLRLQTMASYFDVFRIDHILGFFRIWEIPWSAVQGILGHFNPTMPIHVNEFNQRGIWFDYDRFCKPYIREHMLKPFFGTDVKWVKDTFLTEYQTGCFQFKPEFDSQRKIESYLALPVDAPMEKRAHHNKIMEGLFGLHAEVLFMEAPFSNKTAFNPRNSFHFTYSYRELDDDTKARLNDLYIHYFYKRMEEFWKNQALVKLPAITSATNMLVCGEDLGMVPDCVPPTMRDLGMLSLEIQRMPKNPKVQFGHPADAPYLSVVTPSSHDMSTIRGWWEEDREKTQKFYNNMLGHGGAAPFFCEHWVVKEIVVQHLYSPAMWAIFPIQDLIGMDADLRRTDVDAEKINVPANPKHYWKYRFHIEMEELLEKNEFNNTILQLTRDSGRNSEY